jgi:hypothetical protein
MAMGESGLGSREPTTAAVVQTNPIPCRWAGKTIPKATGLEAATRVGQMCKTKPISAGGRGDACAALTDPGRLRYNAWFTVQAEAFA